MSEKTFYVVARDKDNISATRRHDTFEQAEPEAMRLSEKERVTFIILKAVAIYRPAETPIEKVFLIEQNECEQQIKPG